MWPFSGQHARASARPQWNLSTPLLHLSDADAWTIGDACNGCLALGGTGSGKSTGSMATIILAYLRAGFGGVFLTSKPDDSRTYAKFCRMARREHDLLVFGPGRGLRFNPLDAELQRKDAGAGLTENIRQLLCALPEVRRRNQPSSRQEEGSYWQDTFHQAVRNTIDLQMMAEGRLSVPDLYRLVVSAPTSREQAKSAEWQSQSYCFQSLLAADARERRPERRKDLRVVRDFFLVELAGLADRTRSIVVSTFSSTLDVLNRSPIRELISGESNISLDWVRDGAIFLFDCPVKIFGEVGAFLQVMGKYCFQQSQERHSVDERTRPAFLVSDESHLLAVAGDDVFQTTARSSKTAVLNATQSISNYLAAFGGERAEAQVHSLLGNLQTKIFHQQADIKTNEYAAQLIGRSRQFLINSSTVRQPGEWLNELFGGQGGQSTAGLSECFEFEIQPNEFSRLRRGGPPQWIVDSIVYQGGRSFSQTGRPWMRVSFQQQL